MAWILSFLMTGTRCGGGAVIRQQPHKSMILIGTDKTDFIYLRLRYISEYILDPGWADYEAHPFFVGAHVTSGLVAKQKLRKGSVLFIICMGGSLCFFSMRQRIWF